VGSVVAPYRDGRFGAMAVAWIQAAEHRGERRVRRRASSPISTAQAPSRTGRSRHSGSGPTACVDDITPSVNVRLVQWAYGLRRTVAPVLHPTIAPRVFGAPDRRM